VPFATTSSPLTEVGDALTNLILPRPSLGELAVSIVKICFIEASTSLPAINSVYLKPDFNESLLSNNTAPDTNAVLIW